uniref:SFRICE_027304 n=1 Tax=Spodoptera frugiperda TaxID=7108 RepID=A0A2H1VNF5_SPOFR
MKLDTDAYGSKCSNLYPGMETDEDVGRGNMLDNMPPISCDGTLEGETGTSSNEIGDLTFCMGNYISDFMKMMFTMRSHHMLTDVVLEVGNELFHVHKVVLAAGSPYFKVQVLQLNEAYEVGEAVT